jgi:septal ring factor EnvC (AmiA/AmiB activator)
VFSLALTLCHALDEGPREHVAAGAVDAFVAFRAAHAPKVPRQRDLRDLKPYFERWLAFSPDFRPSAEEFLRELSALTRPEEKAARRWAIMRWALPSMIALSVLVSGVIFLSLREASVQRREAEVARERAQEARQRAETIYADLTVEEARRRELEANVEQLEKEYKNSQMTREQLASRLAESEAEMAIVNERERGLTDKLRKQNDEEHALRELNAKTSGELAQSKARSDDLNGELERQRARRSEAEASVNQLRDQLKRESEELERTRARVAELEERVTTMRKALQVPQAERPTKHGLTPEL